MPNFYFIPFHFSHFLIFVDTCCLGTSMGTSISGIGLMSCGELLMFLILIFAVLFLRQGISFGTAIKSTQM